jgi:transcriptional regulator with XRE-family HTH domain
MRRQPGLCGITTTVFTFVRIRSPRAIAEELLTLRERQGLTRNALAARSGISRSTLGRLAAGRSVPTIEMLVKLAKLELATSACTFNEMEEHGQQLAIPGADGLHLTASPLIPCTRRSGRLTREFPRFVPQESTVCSTVAH